MSHRINFEKITFKGLSSAGFLAGIMAMSGFSQTFTGIDHMTLMSNFKHPGTTGLNHSAGIWGHTTASGKEFAVYTNRNPGGVEFVDITNPATPTAVNFISSQNNSIWQEVDCFKTTCYKVSEQGTTGIQIINIAPLNTGAPATLSKSMLCHGMTQSHTVFSDTTGYNGVPRLYATCGGTTGTAIYTLADPLNPVEVGWISGETHDIHARGKYLFTCKQRQGIIRIYDVSNPGSPTTLSTITLNGGATTISHNAALSMDGKLLFATEEETGRPITVWDVSNIAAPKMYTGGPGGRNEYGGPAGVRDAYGKNISANVGQTIVHNVFTFGKYMWVAYYTGGAHMVNIDTKDTAAWLRDVGFHDPAAQPPTGTGLYGGTWGTYNWFPSHNFIHGTDNGGLYVLKPDASIADPWSTGVSVKTDGIAHPEFFVSSMNRNAISFQLPQAGAYVLSIISPSGREVFSQRNEGTSGMQSLHLNNLGNGAFIARLQQGNTVRSSTVISKN